MDEGRLTQAEILVVQLLGRATEVFMDLPEHHPTDIEEWVRDVHHLQHRVMSRAAVRRYPDLFTPLEDTEGTE